MNLKRLFVVFLAVTLFFGAFGAAIGAGFGLIGGSILGCLAALVDQVLFVLRGLAQKRGDSTA